MRLNATYRCFLGSITIPVFGMKTHSHWIQCKVQTRNSSKGSSTLWQGKLPPKPRPFPPKCDIKHFLTDSLFYSWFWQYWLPVTDFSVSLIVRDLVLETTILRYSKIILIQIFAWALFRNINVWNSLTAHVVDSYSVTMFKRRLFRMNMLCS